MDRVVLSHSQDEFDTHIGYEQLTADEQACKLPMNLTSSTQPIWQIMSESSIAVSPWRQAGGVTAVLCMRASPNHSIDHFMLSTSGAHMDSGSSACFMYAGESLAIASLPQYTSGYIAPANRAEMDKYTVRYSPDKHGTIYMPIAYRVTNGFRCLVDPLFRDIENIVDYAHNSVHHYISQLDGDDWWLRHKLLSDLGEYNDEVGFVALKGAGVDQLPTKTLKVAWSYICNLLDEDAEQLPLHHLLLNQFACIPNCVREDSAQVPVCKFRHSNLVAILVLAGSLRLTIPGYHTLQIDEAHVVLLTARLFMGTAYVDDAKTLTFVF